MSETPAIAFAESDPLLEQLDSAPMTRLHKRLVLAAGLGVFLDGYDLVIIGIAMIFIRRQWHISHVESSMLGSAALAGALIGALSAGRIADRFGRKAIYLIDLIAFFASALMCALAWNIGVLIAFRLLLGIGVGADYPLSATYLAEFSPKKSRGAAITLMFGLWSIGAITAGFTGLALWQIGPSNWRWMLGLGALPAILVIWLRRDLPESPRWYLRRGNVAAAAAVVKRLRPTISQAQLDQILAHEHGRLITPAPSWRILFSRHLIRATLLASFPWFIMDLVGYYLTIYQPTILKHLGFVGVWDRILGSTVLSFSFLIGFVPLVLLVDRIGRIVPQIIGFIGSGVCLVIIGAIAGSAASNGGKFTPAMVAVAFGCMLFSTACNSFGPGNTTYMIPAEVYPTSVRATGHGFATAFSRFGAVISTFFLPLLELRISKPLFFDLLGGLSLVAAWLTWQFRIDSRQKPLAQE
ncbi:MAG: MFS transporter [Phycisphaerae bacterium]